MMKLRTLAFLLLTLWAAPSLAQIPWPVGEPDLPSPINGTLGELRGSMALSAKPHLHDGVDIAAPATTPVYVVESGPIGNVQHPNDANKSIRIGRFAYVHLDQINPELLDLRSQGQPAPAGMLIGTINTKAHLHFKAGFPHALSNPLSELFGYIDESPPNPIEGLRLFDFATDTELPQSNGEYVLSASSIEIRAKASDRQSLGKPEVGVFQIGYRVLGHDPGNSYDSGETFKIGFSGLQVTNPSWTYSQEASGDPYPNNFVYIVTNFVDGNASFDASGLVPGEYEFRVIAADIAGNRTEASVLAIRLPAVHLNPFGMQDLSAGPFKVEVIDQQQNTIVAPADITVTLLRQVISQCSGILFSSNRDVQISLGQSFFASLDAAGRDPACNTLPITTRWSVLQAVMDPDLTLDLSSVPSEQLMLDIIR